MKTAFVFLGIRINIASRARRRWLVALIYAAFGVLDILWSWKFGQSPLWILAYAGIAALGRFMGGRTHEGGLIPSYEGGDERERTRRYRAHYLAYNYLDFTFLPAILFAFAQNSPEARRSPAVHLLYQNLTWGLFVAAVILYYTLPQAILLCSEPDLEVQQ